jgi:hypothetical protein
MNGGLNKRNGASEPTITRAGGLTGEQVCVSNTFYIYSGVVHDANKVVGHDTLRTFKVRGLSVVCSDVNYTA